jgi:Spy/CpxP family protein refolding chaperone
MKMNAITAASKALNVLTPDQRTQLADHLQQRESRFQQR